MKFLIDARTSGVQLQVSNFNFGYLRHSHVSNVNLYGFPLNFPYSFYNLWKTTDVFPQKKFVIASKFVIDTIN